MLLGLPRTRCGWLFCLFAVLLGFVPRLAADVIAPRYFGANPGALIKAKARLAAGDQELAPALKKLLAEADEALNKTPPSVMDKTRIPPSGDQHDYMSLAPYFWPNPKSTNGLPYIRRDGEVNPDSRDKKLNDSPRISLMGGSIETLALAYYFSGDEKYAAHAAKFARVWFLDPATRMHPNLKFAQAVSGVNDGRGTGILEGRHIAVAADALGLLAGSKSWTAADQKQLNEWLNNYLDWLLTSKPGQDEANAKNNHGSWFDVQAARIALCLGRTDDARRIVEAAKQRRIAVQIEPDGSQPLELARTKSLGYSCFNLVALSELGTLGKHAGVDLWQFETADGRSLRRALEFLLPYADQPAKPWPYQQIAVKNDFSDVLPAFRQAALACKNPAFAEIIGKNPAAGSQRFQLLFDK